MQSEGGAAGAVHGSFAAGALTTTYTASQGLLLMIPNMYKIAAEQLPGVFHVSRPRRGHPRAVHLRRPFRRHGLPSDRLRHAGRGQRAGDHGPVGRGAPFAPSRGACPFLNFFDGFRTSHEVQKVAVWDYADLADMCDMDAVRRLPRPRAQPRASGHARQPRERRHLLPAPRGVQRRTTTRCRAVVEDYMAQVNAEAGHRLPAVQLLRRPRRRPRHRGHGLASATCAEEVVDYLNADGQKVGLVKVRLYRPVRRRARFAAALPATVRKVAVMDRTKEPGSPRRAAVPGRGQRAGAWRAATGLTVVGRPLRPGLARTRPRASVFAVYDGAGQGRSRRRQFTVGIVRRRDAPVASRGPGRARTRRPAGTIECKFWGLRRRRHRGREQELHQDHRRPHRQVRAGLLPVRLEEDRRRDRFSHLRFGDSAHQAAPTTSTRPTSWPATTPRYLDQGLPRGQRREAGRHATSSTAQWSRRRAWNDHLGAEAKRYIAEQRHQTLHHQCHRPCPRDRHGQTARTPSCSRRSSLWPNVHALRTRPSSYMKDAATKSYLKKGQDVVDMNHRAIDAGATAFVPGGGARRAGPTPPTTPTAGDAVRPSRSW